jgi:hypothetical protein
MPATPGQAAAVEPAEMPAPTAQSAMSAASYIYLASCKKTPRAADRHALVSKQGESG